MTIHFETHRFGPDEHAVGRLIDGDLPGDDNERWSMLDAVRYRIERLLDEHERAQAALRRYRDGGAPFVLYLRSFGSEATVLREGPSLGTSMNLSPLRFQTVVQHQLVDEGASLVRLHGGSDGLLTRMAPREVADPRFEPGVLATNGGNWKAVATELIRSAPAILFLVSELSPGVAEEFDLIRESRREDRTLVVVIESNGAPAGGSDVDVHARLAGFPHVFVLSDLTGGPPRALIELLNGFLGARPDDPPELDVAVSVPFSYIERAFVESEDFRVARRHLWNGLRTLRVVLADDYWAALKARGFSPTQVQLGGPWTLAHKIYGLAAVTADFPAMREAARMLFLLWIQRGADLAFAVATLDPQLAALQERIHPSGSPDNETAACPSPDPLSLPASVGSAMSVFEEAQEAAARQDVATAHHLAHIGVIRILRADDGPEQRRRWILMKMCGDWAGYQEALGLTSWATQNKRLGAAVARELAEEDPASYGRDLDLALNNLGAFLLRHGDRSGAEPILVEALDRRRRRTSDDDEARVDLYHSLANLALLRMEGESYDAATVLLDEAIDVCRRRLPEQPAAIVDLSRVETWMCRCLVATGDTSGLQRYIDRLRARREDLARLDEKLAADLDEVLTEVIRQADRSSHDQED